MAMLQITRLLIMMGMFEKFSYSARNCSPWPAQSKVQCIGFVPNFGAGNTVENLVLNKCQPDLKLSKASFANLNTLLVLEILCEFASNNSGLAFEDKVFAGIEGNLQWLYLENNNIRRLPDGTFCNTSKLNWMILSHNSIEDLSKIGFSFNVCSNTEDISHLDYLCLRNNLLSTIKNNTFDKLHQLDLLDLAHNHLHEIEDDAFVGLANLRILDLSYNKLAYISDEVFKNVTSLLSLFVSNNKLNSNSVTVINRHLTKLVALNVANNAIEVIDENSFRNLSELQSLDLSNNPFTIIGHPFQTLAYLQVLNFNKVGLNHLNLTVLQNLKYLKKLHLKNNNLTYIDPNVFNQITELDELYLSGNRLLTVPDFSFMNKFKTNFNTIFKKLMPNLPSNNLQPLFKSAPINAFPDAIQQAKTMIDHAKNMYIFEARLYENAINLDHNSITEIDSNFSKITAKNISIAFNRLKILNFEHVPTWAYELNASNNEIHTLQPGSKQLSLVSIDLSNNRITRVTPENIPPYFQNFYLHNNLVEYLSPDFFSYSLKLITLHGNKLKHLCPPTEDPRYKLLRMSLTISENPLVCSCELDWLTKYDELRFESIFLSIIDYDKVKCEVPFAKSTDETKIHVKGYGQHENFLCKSNNTHPYSCNCLMHNSWCLMPCPQLCTCYHNAESSFLILDCASQNLTIIPDLSTEEQLAEFQTMIIYFDGSFIEQISQHAFDSYLHAKQLFLNNSAISTIDASAFDKLSELVKLHLDNNNLQTLPEFLFDNLVKLRELYLSNNQISQLASNMFASLNDLQLLTLENNSLTNLPIWNLQSRTLKKLTLQGNPFVCECHYVKKFREWLQQGQHSGNQSNYVKDIEKLTCKTTSAKLVPIISYELEFCQEEKLHIWLPALGVFVFLTVVSICLFVYRHELQVLVYAKYGYRMFSTNEDDDANKVYDIFISYSSLDDEFVVFEFLPKLEEIEHPYRVCLHQRDFVIGRHIMNNIFESVQNSRRTIVVLTRKFVESQWCKFEFKVAHCQMIEDRCNRLIMVLKDEPPLDQLEPEMKLYMKTNTYLKWGDTQFWDKLYFALPDARVLQTNPVFINSIT